MTGTMDDLHKLYPGSLPSTSLSKMKETTLDKKLAYFCKILKSISDSWTKNHRLLVKFKHDNGDNKENNIVEQLVDMVSATLHCMIKAARDLFDVKDEEELEEDGPQLRNQRQRGLNYKEETFEKSKIKGKEGMINSVVTSTRSSETGKPITIPPPPPAPPMMPSKGLARPAPPPPAPPMMPSTGSARPSPPPPPPPPLRPSHPPPPPPMMPSKGSARPAPPPPPPAMPLRGSAPTTTPLKQGPGPPLPPPPGGGKLLFQKKVTSKLKRSTQMSRLFRILKQKMEASSLAVESTNESKKQLGGSLGGKQGMTDTIAELTKRSPYFQQIEEDTKNHSKAIMELKIAINSFQTKDMTELIVFQKNAESILEILTDETQVLAKFEDFPTKKLEALRAASALYLKFNKIVTDLKKWEIEPPLSQLLHKLENHFSKIKLELDAFDRSKDEESKKFKSFSIDFDFNIITRIREAMVDVSSGCIELALKERREAKSRISSEATGCKTSGQTKEVLWRAFQLAFRVYSFAGGQDDRAEKLATELANQILID